MIAADAIGAMDRTVPATRRHSRDRLLAAAIGVFGDRGYAAASVEEIAAAAGVSRMTFYRQFASKADLTIALFEASSDAALPRLTAIAGEDWRDPAVVLRWLGAVFAADRGDRQMIQLFFQASADDDGIAARAHKLIDRWIAALGATIPSFDLDPSDPMQRARWTEAWLLLFDILNHSNHAARGSGIFGEPQVVDLLACRFARFVEREPGS